MATGERYGFCLALWLTRHNVPELSYCVQVADYNMTKHKNRFNSLPFL